MSDQIERDEVIEITDEYPADRTTALVASTRGTFEGQLSRAQDIPRDLAAWSDQVFHEATANMETAIECSYAKPIGGGEKATGPSVRLAEIIFQNFENADAGSQIVEVGREFVRARGWFIDFERNVRYSEEVTKSIMTSPRKGAPQRYSASQIATTCSAACAIAFRNAVIKGVGRHRIMPIYRRVMVMAKGTETQLPDLRKGAMDYIMNTLAVPRANILAAVNVERMDDMTLDDVFELRRLTVAIQDGEITKFEAFPSPSNRQKVKGSDDPLGDVLREEGPRWESCERSHPDAQPCSPCDGKSGKKSCETCQGTGAVREVTA